VEDRLVGTNVPVLSVSLSPGESIVARAGEFCWMTDSIQMSAGQSSAVDGDAVEAALLLSTFTAKQAAGTINFACRLPGSILGVDVSPAAEYLVHQHGFVVGTPGIRVGPGFRQPFSAGIYAAEGFRLQRISGEGRAWIEFAGEVVRLELAAGESLRTQPGHVGMFAASVAFQLMRVPGIANRYFGSEAHHFAALSGPGPVWLQSLLSPVLTAPPP
jgi:uncharacterized protein (AIM24 family)